MFIVLSPGTPYNRSAYYRVADEQDWLEYEAGNHIGYPYSSYPTYLDARAAKDRFNEEQEETK